MSLDPGRWANAVRAVRDARGLVYNDPEPSIDEAHETVKLLRATGEPQLVAETDDIDILFEALNLFGECGVASVNPIIETEENVLEEGDDEVVLDAEDGFTMSVEGIRAALVTLSVANGEAPSALLIAGVYFTATHDPLWLEVRHLIRTTFQPPSPQVMVTPSPEDVA